MNYKQLKQLLHTQKKKVRQKWKLQQALIKKQRKEFNKSSIKQKQKQTLFLKLLLLTLLIALLLRNCNCDKPPLPENSAKQIQPLPTPKIIKKEIKKKFSRKPLKGKIKPRKRPKYKNEPSNKKAWLANFRLQVAARSPRLAKCFEDAQHPGALKWVAAVEPVQGVVFDQTFEPILGNADLTKAEQKCLKKVLTEPPYNLKAEKETSVPSRVGIVIEF